MVASAKAQTFPQLLIASSLVGAGEAGLIPIGFAMIPELFRGRRRQVANSIFSGALLLSSAIAFALCGQLISRIELARHALPIGLQTLDVWRLSFFAAALPAPLMLLLIGTISLPRSVAVKDVESARLTNNSLTSYLRQHRSTFLTFYLGNGFSLVGLVLIASWLPVILIRLHGQTPAQVGAAMSLTTFWALVAVRDKYVRGALRGTTCNNAASNSCVLDSMLLCSSRQMCAAVRDYYEANLRSPSHTTGPAHERDHALSDRTAEYLAGVSASSNHGDSELHHPCL